MARTDLIKANISKYKADMDKAIANVHTYMHNSVGIGEHPDLVEAVHEQITAYADAKELLDSANEILDWFED